MLISRDIDIIIACCTPKGSGAVALLRLTGDDVILLADKISQLASNKKLIRLPTHTIHYGWVVDAASNHIDQVLFLLMRAPNTFTGQDTVEITCHNNPFIIEAIIQQAIAHGARLAQEGEFTKRAVLNSKIDLIQAEAINELIHANTQLALKQSLSQLQGSFTNWIHHIEQDLIKALALSESSFEFIDEENMEFGVQIKNIVEKTLHTTEQLKKTFDQQQHIRQGIRIAIIGSVNAGKSSLFNALLNRDRAIVTNIAGTTRDTIEAGLYKNGNYWTLIDTAGLRQTDDVIEQVGVKRSFEEAQQADIILLVYDNSQKLLHEELEIYNQLIAKYQHKVIAIINKCDLPQQKNNFTVKSVINISTKEKQNIGAVEHAIQEKILHLFNDIESPFLLNQRQFNVLLSFEKKLLDIHMMLKNDIQYELVSIHLTDALAHLSELTGKTISEAGMDAVFREFCVGK